MKYIKRKYMSLKNNIEGNIVDTLNISNKEKNAPSLRLTQELAKNKNVYSSDNEQVVGKWMGKPLYRLVIYTKTGTADVDTIIFTYNSNFNIINMTGVVDVVTQHHSLNMYYDSAHMISTYVEYSNHTIHCKCTGYGNTKDVRLVLEYTKTSDSLDITFDENLDIIV